MNVHPTPSGHPRGAGPERLKEPIPLPVSRPSADPAPEPLDLPVDRVELSPDARELQRPAERGKILSLSDARLKGVAQRLAAGFYDRPEIQEAVLGRLMSDLEDTPTGA